MKPVKNHYSFKPGERVKIFNGGRLEGLATIKKQLPQDDDFYRVHFDEDPEGADVNRWVQPEWQARGFKPGRTS